MLDAHLDELGGIILRIIQASNVGVPTVTRMRITGSWIGATLTELSIWWSRFQRRPGRSATTSTATIATGHT